MVVIDTITRIATAAIVAAVVCISRENSCRSDWRRHDVSKILASLLPPGAGSERNAGVDCLVRCFSIVACICVDTTVGIADNTVVATIDVDVIAGVVPWQRQGRQSIR